MTKAVYPWSFDLFTNWHEDILRKAWERFDSVVVAVWQNPDKKYMFSIPERVEVIKWATKSQVYSSLNIDVKPFWWLLTDFTFEQGSKTVVRGLRWAWDLDWEEKLKIVLENEGIVPVYFFARQDQTHVSSSMSKALLKEQWFIQDYVSLIAKHFMEARMNWQYMVWLTWTIWAWKSYIAEKFIELWEQEWIQVHNIDLDKIWHWILEVATEEWYVKLRQEIVNQFWNSIEKNWWFIDRKTLWEIVFNDTEKRKVLDDIMFKPMQVRIRRDIYWKKWIILLNGAILVEAWITNLSNNNVVLVWVDDKVQQERLSARGLDSEQIERRINSQFTTEKKREIISSNIKKTWYWKLLDFENNRDNELEIEVQFNKMLCNVDVFGEIRIRSIFKRLGIENKWLDIYSIVKPMYDTPDRLYHNWFHIVSCLDELYEIKRIIPENDFLTLFFAILFHDAVYDSRANKWENERNSAKLSQEFLDKLWLDWELITNVSRLIEITINHETDWQDILWAYIADIDLSILWKSWDEYYGCINSIRYGYMRAIRNEYLCYTEEKFTRWRLAFLETKVWKRVFKTDCFHDKYESQAQENISKEIVILKNILSNLW